LCGTAVPQVIGFTRASADFVSMPFLVEDPRADKVLKQFALETGGYAFSNPTATDVPKVFPQIRARINPMYNVTYLPLGPGKPVQFRTELEWVTRDLSHM
jgi:hypothetical protein